MFVLQNAHIRHMRLSCYFLLSSSNKSFVFSITKDISRGKENNFFNITETGVLLVWMARMNVPRIFFFYLSPGRSWRWQANGILTSVHSPNNRRWLILVHSARHLPVDATRLCSLILCCVETLWLSPAVCWSLWHLGLQNFLSTVLSHSIHWQWGMFSVC
jgi:hypothetical protein